MVHSRDLLTSVKFLQLNSAPNHASIACLMTCDIFQLPRIVKKKHGEMKLTAHVNRRLTLALSFPVFTNYSRNRWKLQ